MKCVVTDRSQDRLIVICTEYRKYFEIGAADVYLSGLGTIDTPLQPLFTARLHKGYSRNKFGSNVMDSCSNMDLHLYYTNLRNS